MNFTRREVLKAGSAILALPWLETLALADEKAPPKRIVTVCTSFGLYGPSFFPDEGGAGLRGQRVSEDARATCATSSPSSPASPTPISAAITLRKRASSPAPSIRPGRLPQHGVAGCTSPPRHVGGATRFPLLSLGTGDGSPLTHTPSGAASSGAVARRRFTPACSWPGTTGRRQGNRPAQTRARACSTAWTAGSPS